jgi:hypothetical protein
MATVKTTVDESGQRLVITKVVNGQRRVSCSCCEEPECCMYSAQGLTDGIYTVEDLPDELEMYYSDGVNFDGPTLVAHNGDGTYGELSDEGSADPAYIARSFAGDEWVTSYFQLDPSTDCLIKTLEADDPPSLSTTNVWVFDRFEDTYTISNGFESIAVTRISLCIWEGEGAVLYYAGGGFDALGQNSNVWRSTFLEQNGPKQTGNQNTPTGTYEDPISLGTWSVS